MKRTLTIKQSCAVAVVSLGLLTVNSLNAATVQTGYVIGSVYPSLLDNSGTGGNDYTGNMGFAVQSTNLWQPGQTIRITGVSWPTRTTPVGTITFYFYDLDQGANPNAFDGTGVETLIGTNTATLGTAIGAGTAAYCIFDQPLVFTAHSHGVAVTMVDSGGSQIFKVQPSVYTNVTRVNLNTGAPFTASSAAACPYMRFSIFGSVVQPAPVGSLTWQGNVSSDWDGTTTNWSLALGGNLFAPINYADNGAYGPMTIFDDTLVAPFYTNVNLTTGTPLRPSSVVFNNSVFRYNLSGSGVLTGATVLTNSGSGVVTLNTANDFTGGSVLTGGRVRLGNLGGLGTGPITFRSGALSSVGSAPLTVNSRLSLIGTAVLGNTTDNGTLTLSGQINFNGATYGIDAENNVFLIGVLTNGGIGAKTGPGTLTLAGGLVDDETTGTWAVQNGAMVVDGISATRAAGAISVGASAGNGVASFIITNGAAVNINNAAVVSVGAIGQSANTSSNYLYLSGTLAYATNYPGGVLQLGQSSAYDEFDMLPGSLLSVGGLTYNIGQALANISVVNLNGGTIAALKDNANFIPVATGAFTTAVNVLGGGVTFDSGSYAITIAQPLLDGGGGGGLVKLGTGTLWLAGANTYTGPTVVKAGTVGLYPGSTLSAASSLIVSNGAAVAADFTTPAGQAETEVSSLSLNGSAVNVNYGDLGGSTSGTVAFNNAANSGVAIDASGVNSINLTGFNLGVGQYPIIQFASRTGSGSFIVDPASRVVGTVVTNGNVIALDLQQVLLAFLTQPVSQRVLTNTPATFSVVVDGTPAPSSYQWYQIVSGATNAIGGANSDTYTTPPVQDSDTGTGFFVVATNVNGSVATSATAILTAGHMVVASGYLHRETYTNLISTAETLISDLYPNSSWLGANPPATTQYVTQFDAPQNLAANSGQRIYGWFTPPVSGDYVFFQTSDDGGDLWLGSDSTSANVYQISQNQLAMTYLDWTLSNTASPEYALLSSGEWRSDQFTAGGGQNAFSAYINGWAAWPNFNHGNGGIPLVAGTKYYIEMDTFQGTGAQNAAVTYKLADSADPVSGTASLLTGADISGEFLDTQLPVNPPVLSGASVSGGKVVLTGTYGLVNAAYNVLTTTNLSLPLSSWSVAGSSYSSSTGVISYTNTINPQLGGQFFRIQIP